MKGILLLESAGDVGVTFWNPATCPDPVIRMAVRKALRNDNEAVRECLDEGEVTCNPSELPPTLRNVPVAQWGTYEHSPLEIVYYYR
jgi:hypothetical protein